MGVFTLASDAAPLKLNVGDPITLKLKISGRGNFDRVTAPVMVDESGWRSYPASARNSLRMTMSGSTRLEGV